MEVYDYAPPLDRLLTLGESVARKTEWPDYLANGIGPEHVPELLRMLSDDSLNMAMGDTKEVWAPLHAWRTLAQLGATEAIGPLVSLLDRIDEADDDWVAEDLPQAFALLGADAIPLLGDYLANPEHGLWGRVAASTSLGKIGERHPQVRDECVAALTRALERFADQDHTLNAFIISDLIELQAREALPLIREAFHGKRVDTGLQGDLESVELALEVREVRSGAPGALPPALSIVGLRPDPSWLRAGRNDPCPCGSGLKFKKCCLPRVQELCR